MTGTCKYCGQEVMLPENATQDEAWLYCRCPEAMRQAQIDAIICAGTEAIETICGDAAEACGLAPIPNATKNMLIAALPAIANGEIHGIKIKLLSESDVISVKQDKGNIHVTREKTNQWVV